MRILAPAALAIAATVGSAAPYPAEPLLVVAQRVELKWSATGRVLGWLGSGARVEKLGGRNGWTRAEVRGWLQAASLEPAGGGARVRTAEGALHATAGGRVLGGLRRGVEVRVLERASEWSEISMIGWLPDSTVAPAPAGSTEAAAPPERPSTVRAPDEAGSPAFPARLARRVEFRGAPQGEALAQLPSGTVVTALETRGAWTRVSVQGWVPSAAIEAGHSDEAGPEIVVAADPEVFAGRRLTWTVEFVALQRADRTRRDFEPGELFGLARVPGVTGLYVYLVVPDRLAADFGRFAPFQRVRVEGRVRTGRSVLTGNPILEVERLLP